MSAKDYAEVFSARRVLRGKHFALHFRKQSRPGVESRETLIPRIGLVIPKKQARTAVLRNAIKRQAREVFRRRRPALPAMDLVLRLAAPTGVKNRPVASSDKLLWRNEIAGLLDRLCSHDGT